MKEVLEFLKKSVTYYIATMDGDQPRVRPFGTIAEFEGSLYILTSNEKPISRQLSLNPKAEICAMNGNDWIRVSTALVEDDRIELKRHMLEEYPDLRNIYSLDDGIMQVFRLTKSTAVFSSFTQNPRTVKF